MEVFMYKIYLRHTIIRLFLVITPHLTLVAIYIAKKIQRYHKTNTFVGIIVECSSHKLVTGFNFSKNVFIL